MQQPKIVPVENATEKTATDETDAQAHENKRILEAVLFAAAEPLDPASLSARLPVSADFDTLIGALQADYATRGVNLVNLGGRWSFRTADDLAFVMHREALEQKRLSRAALETLAIIAYHQPVTRSDIEEIRGVSISKGTLDILLQANWVQLKGRRRTPGRPVTYGTTNGFLEHFSLASLDDLPGLDELKAVGLLNSAPRGGFPTASHEDADDADDADDAGANDAGADAEPGDSFEADGVAHADFEAP
ncbi:MAG: SMC-Scp complex subunit ScpB [Alphaproteobacteria bacterium]